MEQGKVLRKVLSKVMWINYSMFAIEFLSGYFAKSTALMADSLDLLGDAAIYGVSWYAIQQGPHWRARTNLFNGSIMALFGFFVMGQAIYRAMTGTVPFSLTVTSIGFLALLVNVFCMILLYQYRHDDSRMRTVWLCSRNDIFANIGVVIASCLVAVTGSGVPDVVVGFAIAALYLKTAYDVVRVAN